MKLVNGLSLSLSSSTSLLNVVSLKIVCWLSYNVFHFSLSSFRLSQGIDCVITGVDFFPISYLHITCPDCRTADEQYGRSIYTQNFESARGRPAYYLFLYLPCCYQSPQLSYPQWNGSFFFFVTFTIHFRLNPVLSILIPSATIISRYIPAYVGF